MIQEKERRQDRMLLGFYCPTSPQPCTRGGIKYDHSTLSSGAASKGRTDLFKLLQALLSLCLFEMKHQTLSTVLGNWLFFHSGGDRDITRNGFQPFCIEIALPSLPPFTRVDTKRKPRSSPFLDSCTLGTRTFDTQPSGVVYWVHKDSAITPPELAEWIWSKILFTFTNSYQTRQLQHLRT